MTWSRSIDTLRWTCVTRIKTALIKEAWFSTLTWRKPPLPNAEFIAIARELFRACATAEATWPALTNEWTAGRLPSQDYARAIKELGDELNRQRSQLLMGKASKELRPLQQLALEHVGTLLNVLLAQARYLGHFSFNRLPQAAAANRELADWLKDIPGEKQRLRNIVDHLRREHPELAAALTEEHNTAT